MGTCESQPSQGFSDEPQTRFNPFFESHSAEGLEHNVLSKYNFVSNYEDRFLGRCSVIEQRQSGNLYLSKDIVLDNEQQCESVYRTLLEKKQQQKNCEEILRIKQIFYKNVDGFFRDSKKIILIVEYPLISLKKEFNNRLLNKLEFDKEEVTKIMYSAIRGYAAIERSNSKNDKVRMAHVFIGVHHKESLIKVIDSGLLSGPSNLQCTILKGCDNSEHHDVYLAPEQFQAFVNKKNVGSGPTSGVFSLGMMILDLSLMEPSRNAYHFHSKSLANSQVRNLITIAGKKQGSNIQKFLIDMLEFDPVKRLSFTQLQEKIPQMFSQSGTSNNGILLSVVKNEDSNIIVNDNRSLRSSRGGSVYSSRISSQNRVFTSSIKPAKPEEEEYQNSHEQYTNGNQYIGQKKNGLKHGKGKYIFKDRSYYQGFWRNGLMDGKGVLYLPNGKVEYEGEWKQDEPNGWGLMYAYELEGKPFIWKTYEGELNRGEMQGRGKLQFADGTIYQGEFRNGKIFGKGRRIDSSGSVVEKDWDLQTLQHFARGASASSYQRD